MRRKQPTPQTRKPSPTVLAKASFVLGLSLFTIALGFFVFNSLLEPAPSGLYFLLFFINASTLLGVAAILSGIAACFTNTGRIAGSFGIALGTLTIIVIGNLTS